MEKKERRSPTMEQGLGREKGEAFLARGRARESKGEDKWRLREFFLG
jgi:hypothetical protein